MSVINWCSQTHTEHNRTFKIMQNSSDKWNISALHQQNFCQMHVDLQVIVSFN